MPDTPTEKRPFLLGPRSKRPETATAKADWLIMAYLAADNDLEDDDRCAGLDQPSHEFH